MGHHLTPEGNFRSDKYDWCPEGFFALKFTDPKAREAIAYYALICEEEDEELGTDLLFALSSTKRDGEEAGAGIVTMVHRNIEAITWCRKMNASVLFGAHGSKPKVTIFWDLEQGVRLNAEGPTFGEAWVEAKKVGARVFMVPEE